MEQNNYKLGSKPSKFSTKSLSRHLKLLGLIALLFLAFSSSNAQQVIGSFSYMNGGFEGQTAGSLATSVSSSNWTRQNQSGASSSIVNSSTSARSGNNYASVTNVATASRALQSPQDATASNGPSSSTQYVVQFFVKNASSVNGFQGGVTINGTSNPSYSTAATLSANSTWTKQTFVLTTSGTTLTTAGIGIVRSQAGSFDIDDFVIYSGSAADVTAPDQAGTVTINNATTTTLDVNWTAPVAGVDGGGYVVVRYAVSPDANDTVNQNGIYAYGNTITVVNTGTVVYTGTGTTFTDTSLVSGSTYYYNVYTVDKAFNYATVSSGNGTTSSGAMPTITLSSPSQVTAASQNQGTSNIVLSQFQADVTTSSATLDSLKFTTGGTYDVADITNFKLWHNTTNTFAGAAQIGSSITSIPATGTSATFGTLASSITNGSIGYYFITCDLAATAIAANTINIAANPTLYFAAGTPTGTIAAGGDQTFTALVPGIAISPAHPASGSLSQNSTNNIIASFQFDVTIANTTLSDITVTTAGTYQTSDIASNGFKIWANTTNDLTGAIQLGSGIASVSSGNNLVFSSLNESIASGSTKYILITADIVSSAIGGGTLSITSTAFTNINFTSGTKTGTDPVAASNDQTIPTPSIAIADNHTAASDITTGSVKNNIGGYSLAVTNANTVLTEVTITTAGTYATSDFQANSFKLWYNTTNSLASATQLGTGQAIVASGNTVTFTGLTQAINAGVTGYLFVTVDVADLGMEGNTISLASTAFANFIFVSGTKTGTGPVAASNDQTIKQFAFTPGNLIVNRVGTGSVALSSAANSVAMLEMSQSGSLVNTLPLPSGSTGVRCTNSGSATSEGGLTLSLDGQHLGVAGYDTVQGAATVASSTANRVAAFINSTGVINISTIFPTVYSGNNLRGVVSDNDNVWGAGPSSAGVNYTTLGTNGNGTNINGVNSRFPYIFAYLNGDSLSKQLFVGTTTAVNAVGSGLPVAAATNTAIATIASSSVLQYVFFDADATVAGLDLLYVANKNGTASVGGVFKYYFDGTTWQAAGSYNGESVCGLTGYINTTGDVVLFITSGTSTSGQPTNLYTITDASGRTASISGSFTGGGTLATAGTNYAIRGLAWAPTSFVTQPSDLSVCALYATPSFTVAMQTGANARYEYVWQRSTDAGTTWNNITSSLDGGVYTSYDEATLHIMTGTGLNGYQFRCLVRYMSQYWLTSDAATLTAAPLTVSGSISGSSAICSGSTSGTLTLSGETGSIVNWESSVAPFTTWTTISDTTNTYTSGALTETTLFRAIVQSGACPSDISDTATVTVDPVSVGGSISGSSTICSGSTSGTLTLSGETGSVVNWESSVSPFTSWTSISNTTNTYTSGALTETTLFRAVVQSGSCASAISDTATVTVDPVSVGGSISGGSSICSGSTSDVLTLTGETGSVVNWESSVAPFTTWTTIANTANTYTSGALTETTLFRAIVQSGVCASAISDTATVTVDPVSVGGTMSGSSTICSGLTSGTLTLSGETGSIVNWESSVAPFTTWTTIANTANTYTSGALTETTLFRAIVQSGACASAVSDTATVTVDPASVGGSISGSSTICSGSTSGTLTLSGETGSITDWESSVAPFTSWTSVSNTTNTYTSGALTATTLFRAIVQSGSCASAVSDTATITVTSQGVWLGVTSSDWSDASNWCGGVPSNTTDVVIPASAPNSALINTAAVVNTITIETGATLAFTGSGNSLEIEGSVTNNGTFTTTGGTVIFGGSSAQTIPALTFDGLTIAGGSDKALSGNTTVTGTLTLTSGTITLGTNDLTVASTGAIAGGSASSFIVTDNAGSLIQQAIGSTTNSGTITYPVGSGTTSFNPVTIQNTGTDDDFSIRVFAGINDTYTGSAPSGTAITSNAVDRTWIVSEATAGGSTATLTFQWNAADELSGFTRASSYVAQYDGTNWISNSASAATGTDPYTQTLAGVTSFSPFGIGSGGMLPVQLISFDGKQQHAHVELQWITASEINNDRFEILRSFDGHTFQTIGNVVGKGNSSAPTAYTYTDKTVVSDAKQNNATVAYYKLRQVDKNGAAELSKTILIGLDDKAAQARVVVSPNPFTDNTNVTIYNATEGKGTLRIVDMQGKIIAERAVELVAGENTIFINELNASAGVYFMSITTGTTSSTQRIVKLNK